MGDRQAVARRLGDPHGTGDDRLEDEVPEVAPHLALDIRGKARPGVAHRDEDTPDREVRRHFGNLVFETVVPRSVRVAEAPSHGLPITHYDRRSRGADAYWKVAMELVERS